MDHQQRIDAILEGLIEGDRTLATAVVRGAIAAGMPAEDVMLEILWPAYEQIERAFRADTLTTLSYRFATRLLRVLCDRVSAGFDTQPSNGSRVFAVCGPTDADELAGQMACDLLEREGYEIAYAGGSIATDEILEHVQNTQPDVLLLFASSPADLPEIRLMIDRLNEIGACRATQIVVGGGVFNRAEGLAEEIGADLWGEDPLDVCQAIMDEPERRATDDQRTVGRQRRPQAKAA